MPIDLQHPVRAIEADGYTGVEVSLRRYAGRGAAGEVQDGLQIPRKSPFHITLSAAEAAELNRRAAKYMLPYFEVVRARVTLVAASGMANNEIAPCLSTRRVGADRKLIHGDKHRWPPKPRSAGPFRPSIVLLSKALEHNFPP